jgi:hypothetical protein
MKLVYSSILFILFFHIGYSQQEYKSLSQKLSKADSVWVIDYTYYGGDTSKYKFVRGGMVDSIAPKSIFRLRSKTKAEFISILNKETQYHGRYASCGGCSPNQVVLIWVNGLYLYFEISLLSHDILAGKGFGFEHLTIDPHKADDLEYFFKRQGIIKTKVATE